MFGLHKTWNIDRLMGLSLRTSAESVPWFAAALFAWLVIAAFCTLISFGRCAFKDPDSCGAFLVPDVISAGRYSPVSGALAFWGLFCTVTLLFFTVPVLVVFSALGGCVLVFFLGMGQACFCSFMDPSIYTFTCLVAVYSEVRGIYLPFSGPVITFWCALCGGFLYSAADFLRSALQNAFGLLSVSFLLLLLRRASLLPVSTFVSVQHLFPLGLLVGCLERSLLPGSICVFDPVLAFVALLLGTLCLMVFRLVHISQTWVTLGPFKDAAVQVQFIPAPPALLQVPVPSLPPRPCQQYAVLPMPALQVQFHPRPRFCPPVPVTKLREVILLALGLGIPWSSSTIVVCGS